MLVQLALLVQELLVAVLLQLVGQEKLAWQVLLELQVPMELAQLLVVLLLQHGLTNVV